MKNAISTLTSLTVTLSLTSLSPSFAQSDSLDAAPHTEEMVLPETTNLPEGTMDSITLKARLQKVNYLPLSLENALLLAEGKNITIALEEEKFQERKDEYYLKLSDLLPDFIAEYSQSRFVGALQIFGGDTFNVYRTTYQPQLTANYTVYSAGQNIFEIRASKQRQEAQRQILEETHQDILRQVARAYYDLQQAYWDRAIYLQAIKEAQKLVDLSKARYETGLGVKLDILQAQTDLSNRKLDLLQAEQEATNASLRLSRLLNMDVSEDIVPASLESSLQELVSEDIPFNNLLNQAKVENPRLKSFKNLEYASQEDLKAAIASVFPKFDIIAFINGTGPAFSSLGLSRFAGVMVSTNLFENSGLSYPLRVKQARTLRDIAHLAFLEAERTLEEELSTTLTRIETLKHEISLSRETLDFARLAYEQAKGRFESGVGDILEVESAMVKLNRARADLARSFLDFNKTQVDLLANLGLLSFETITQGYQGHGQRYNLQQP